MVNTVHARSCAMILGAWALVASSCTEDAYVIGKLCGAIGSCPAAGGSAGSGGAAAGGGGTTSTVDGGLVGPDASNAGSPATIGLHLDFSGSGAERLPQTLLGATPTHFLIAADATAATWDARVGTGFDVVAATALTLAEPGPFADLGDVLSHAGAIAFTADSSWAETSSGALALEVVFRGDPGATLLSQRDANGGLLLSLDAQGSLHLNLDTGAQQITISSQPLVADAWHHCLTLFDLSQTAAQMICNGQAGPVVNVPAGFVVATSAAAVSSGDSSAARVHWAQIARWQATSWGPRGAWTDLARERFARLVGSYAAGSFEPLPFAEVRASGAYIDMTPSDAPDLRRLHPVGEHWPRIVCRPTGDSARNCGLLIETSSSRLVPEQDFTLDNWNASEVSLTAASAIGPVGSDTLFALTPSTANAEHSFELSTPFGEGPAVLSFFARSGSASLIRAEVGTAAAATFDLTALSVSDEQGTLVSGVESWGDGLVRASFSFDINPGQDVLRLAILADDGSAAFAGNGSIAAHVGNVELRFRSYSTPLPTFGPIQQADHLVYPAGNGNLPPGSAFEVSAEIWLPNTPLVADAAIFNANFAAQYEQQINLFVPPQDATPQFWGLQGPATLWNLVSPVAVNDGNLHQITASVGPSGATLGVDDQVSSDPDAIPLDLSGLDRIEVGISTSSSGPFTGIIRQLRILPPSP
ncbi:MAG TPA: hypothetical protein VHO25_02505 [Polyangiaceae bacterium]|nr:hypothetical protein [Polyangiaceae bacterium]